MNIKVNGEKLRVANPASIRELLGELGMGERRVAVEKNGAIIPRSRHDREPVAEGDQFEIVQAIGGG